jgi:acetyl esterase/lipase
MNTKESLTSQWIKKSMHVLRLSRFFYLDLFSKHHYASTLKIKIFNSQAQANREILYFPGGAYLYQASFLHHHFLTKVSKILNIPITLIQYPVGKNTDLISSLGLVETWLQDYQSQKPNTEFILMGDSAGAHFALSLANKLKSFPFKSITLLSPWLDLQCTQANKQKDLILNKKVLIKQGHIYAPNISNFTDIPPHAQIHIFMGEEDLLKEDALAFIKAFPLSNYLEYPHMIHDFFLLPIPETKQLLQDLEKWILN